MGPENASVRKNMIALYPEGRAGRKGVEATIQRMGANADAAKGASLGAPPTPTQAYDPSAESVDDLPGGKNQRQKRQRVSTVMSNNSKLG